MAFTAVGAGRGGTDSSSSDNAGTLVVPAGDHIDIRAGVTVRNPGLIRGDGALTGDGPGIDAVLSGTVLLVGRRRFVSQVRAVPGGPGTESPLRTTITSAMVRIQTAGIVVDDVAR